ncbi:hypothetical protein [Paracoccus sp. (in: a-proteobacteria)]|uniref:hypothetical protein n=1 Tax=Paracoccus sp. TaxID=267 RepID=UPI002AFECD43|nr:hypothetical protein [Paracoccus sp. (in: a-proteobacteria)]
MAESQVPYAYDPQSVDALKASLSPQRFETYLAKAGGDEHYAFALYLYNARLAKSLLFPLSVTEVTLRNAVNSVLVASHGESWHQDATLRNQVLTAQSLDALDRAFIRAKSNARGKVIAELTFDFWSKSLPCRLRGALENKGKYRVSRTATRARALRRSDVGEGDQ